jgi:hypothetical protein
MSCHYSEETPVQTQSLYDVDDQCNQGGEGLVAPLPSSCQAELGLIVKLDGGSCQAELGLIVKLADGVHERSRPFFGGAE